MLGWGSTFCVRESKLSRVAARFEYQHFSKSAPTRLQVCLAAWPRFSSLHALSCVMNEHDHRARCISFTETFDLCHEDPFAGGRPHIFIWMVAAIQLARKCHERAGKGMSRLLALLCVVEGLRQMRQKQKKKKLRRLQSFRQAWITKLQSHMNWQGSGMNEHEREREDCLHLLCLPFRI